VGEYSRTSEGYILVGREKRQRGKRKKISFASCCGGGIEGNGGVASLRRIRRRRPRGRDLCLREVKGEDRRPSSTGPCQTGIQTLWNRNCVPKKKTVAMNLSVAWLRRFGEQSPYRKSRAIPVRQGDRVWAVWPKEKKGKGRQLTRKSSGGPFSRPLRPTEDRDS